MDSQTQPLSFWQKILTRRMLICVFTGFTSGLPYFFIMQLLPAWLHNKVDLKEIGLLALITLPFSLKFLWAPFLDRYAPPSRLGRRRGWMWVTQISLLISMSAYALLSPEQEIELIATLSFVVCFLSASQDIVIDAYRREILSDSELGLGNSIHVYAYRIAGLIPGALSLYLADGHLPWSTVFIITASFMSVGLILTLFLAEKEAIVPNYTKMTFEDSFIKPLQEFFTRKGMLHALLVLAFLMLYKLGDNMATTLLTPFYLDLGFSKTDIAFISKGVSFWSAIVFGILGGVIMVKVGINKALWLFGVVQAVTILGFAWLASFGHFDAITSRELVYLGIVVGAEYAGVGLGTAAFVAFTTRETNPAFTATQLALLTSLTAVPRSSISASSGYLVENLGYTNFYYVCFFLAIPGMLLLFKVAPWNEK